VKRKLNFAIMVFCLLNTFLRLGMIIYHGFEWKHVIWIHVYILAIAISLIWEFHGRHVNTDQADAIAEKRRRDRAKLPLISLVVLLEKARSIDEILLLRHLEPRLDSVELTPVDDTTVNIQANGAHLGIINIDGPYVKDRDAEAEMAASPELATAIREHSAWRCVDWVGPDLLDEIPSPDSINRSALYKVIGNVLAELTCGVRPLALFCPEDGRMTPWQPHLVDILRGPDPMSVFPAVQPEAPAAAASGT
jgi:hypothetical protein